MAKVNNLSNAGRETLRIFVVPAGNGFYKFVSNLPPDVPTGGVRVLDITGPTGFQLGPPKYDPMPEFAVQEYQTGLLNEGYEGVLHAYDRKRHGTRGGKIGFPDQVISPAHAAPGVFRSAIRALKQFLGWKTPPE